MQIEHVSAPTDDARTLIGELEAELAGPYSAEQRHGLSIDRIFQPGIRFFIARLDDEPVGCGGVAFFDGEDFAELKRMYVRPAARGRDVARAILAQLIDEARRRGLSHVMLETGDAQLAAMRFYEREGFTKCGAFGAYAAMQPHEVVRSVFYEMRIG